MDIPIWIDFFRASPGEQVWWNLFLSGLIAHEQGHIDITRKHVELYSRELRKLKVRTIIYCTPQEARAQAIRQFKRERRDFKTSLQFIHDLAQDMYDEITLHGATQGAVAWWCF